MSAPVFDLHAYGAMALSTELLGEMEPPPDPRPWRWFRIVDNGLPYEVEGRTLDGARAAFTLWLSRPIEVAWVRRVWS